MAACVTHASFRPQPERRAFWDDGIGKVLSALARNGLEVVVTRCGHRHHRTRRLIPLMKCNLEDSGGGGVR